MVLSSGSNTEGAIVIRGRIAYLVVLEDNRR